MPSLKRIVCLANSEKFKERCIAGIDLETGKWVRPVCDHLYPENGRIPKQVRQVDNREPELLDILEIPLADTGHDFDFECENLSALPGTWKWRGRFQPRELINYYVDFLYILHNSKKYIYPSYLQSLPFHRRHTLQLVQPINFTVKSQNNGWRGSLKLANGQTLNDASITDPVFVEKLKAGYQLQSAGQYLVTVSLSLPWAPLGWDGEIPCWKLIAGVIEI
jgi:hypothetical protein